MHFDIPTKNTSIFFLTLKVRVTYQRKRRTKWREVCDEIFKFLTSWWFFVVLFGLGFFNLHSSEGQQAIRVGFVVPASSSILPVLIAPAQPAASPQPAGMLCSQLGLLCRGSRAPAGSSALCSTTGYQKPEFCSLDSLLA